MEDEHSVTYDKSSSNNDDFMPVSSFNIISTNARSITPKIENFIDYSNELEANLAFLTETWLSDCDELFSD